MRTITKQCAFSALIILLLTFVILSCVTSSFLFKEIDTAIEQDDFPAAVEAIRMAQGSKDILYDGKDAILLFMDKGLLEYYA